MVLAHIGYLFFPDLLALSLIGRLSFPLFAWGISIGYIHSKNLVLYSARLFSLALISQVPYYFLFNRFNLNVCFTLFLGLLLLMIISNSKINKYFKILLVVLLFLICDITNMEYGMYGLTIILLFHYVEDIHISVILHTFVTIISIYLYHFSSIQFFAILSVFIVTFLRTKKINYKVIDLRKIKLNYLIYPLHLFILLVIK